MPPRAPPISAAVLFLDDGGGTGEGEEGELFLDEAV